MRAHPRILVAASIALTACSGGSGGDASGTGDGGGPAPTKLALHATDAAFVHEIVEEATIEVDRITIHREAEDDSSPIVLYEGDPILMVLTDLRDGVTQFLGEHTLDPGTYRQLRLRVARATLSLVNGNAYSTDDHTIHLTSQGTSGFKVFVDPPLVLEQGLTAGLLLDFDLPKTFLPIPASDPLSADRYLLHPVIHAAHLQTAGGLEGTVSQDDGQGGLVPVEAATVYVLPPGVGDPADSITSTATAADGHYTVLGLEAGVYDVLAVKGDLEASVTGVTVSAGPATVVDLVFEPDPTGGISGIVSQDDGTGTLVPVAGAAVHVLPPGETDPALAVASAQTAADGSYAVQGLPPGTYDVRAVLDPLLAASAGVVVVADATAVVDLVLQ